MKFQLFKSTSTPKVSPLTRSPKFEDLPSLTTDPKVLVIVDYHGFLTRSTIPFLVRGDYPNMYPLEPNGECSFEFSCWFKQKAAFYYLENKSSFKVKQYTEKIFIRMENSNQGLKLYPEQRLQ